MPRKHVVASEMCEFRVAGRLSRLAQDAVTDFGGLRVVDQPSETVIYCDISDPADLRDLLTSLEAFGLGIVSIQRVPESPG